MTYDAVVIGAGAAGMAAACAVAESGHTVAIVDREDHLGGILMQCIHNGFGLHHFKRELTGPEYAGEYIARLRRLPVDVMLETTVLDIRTDGPGKRLTACSARRGVMELTCRAVVLAMGCRERNRGNIGIPGTRPAGVFTAGLAQRLLNIDGCIPGRRVVIVGSGDIGLIMARRLSWVGAKVLCVVEILPYPGGLTRNIVQCLQDFDIPLHLSHSVTGIRGKDRVEGVDIAPLVNGIPAPEKGFSVECDTILLSVGLIPENELSRAAGVAVSPDTGGPVVSANLETGVPGVFACGNVLHVHDLVDFVSEEAARCGAGVAAWLAGGTSGSARVSAVAGPNVKYVTPNSFVSGTPVHFYLRSMIVRDKGELTVSQAGTVLYRRGLARVRPAEMIAVDLAGKQTAGVTGNGPVEFAVG